VTYLKQVTRSLAPCCSRLQHKAMPLQHSHACNRMMSSKARCVISTKIIASEDHTVVKRIKHNSYYCLNKLQIACTYIFFLSRKQKHNLQLSGNTLLWHENAAELNKELLNYSQATAKMSKLDQLFTISKQLMYSRSAVNISCNLQGRVICRLMAGKDSISVLPSSNG
jgi:hypothetical protein